jgi:7-cyano-7-deazaguanine synthase
MSGTHDPDDEQAMHAVVIVSGGMDSVTLAFLLAQEGYELTVLCFDYGQRHKQELVCAQSNAKRLGAITHLVDLATVGGLLAGSALTDDAVAVPEGHYTDESMRATVVPNRNAIFLSIATGVAVAQGAEAVAFGAHAGDHPIYPDCRPSFVEAFTTMALLANEGFVADRFRVLAPFINKTKAEIVRIGVRLGVPYEDTWSCYQGGELHCGRCGTCVERKEAFVIAGVPDPTVYMA